MTPYYDNAGIQIYHGNFMDILPSLPLADLMLTDPPYGVGFAEWDEHISFDWFEKVKHFPRIAFTPGISNIHRYPEPYWIMGWGKPGSTRRNVSGGFNSWEPVLVYGKRKIMVDFINLPDAANHSDIKGHPCPKPARLYTFLVKQLSDEGESIVDPFMGSGTTLRAAKDLGRKAIGIEIEERYCEIAAKRLQQEVFDFGGAQ